MNITIKKSNPLKISKGNKQIWYDTISLTELTPHGACTFKDALRYNSQFIYLYTYFRFVTPTSAPDKGQGQGLWVKDSLVEQLLEGNVVTPICATLMASLLNAGLCCSLKFMLLVVYK